MQIPTCDTGSVGLASDSACGHKRYGQSRRSLESGWALRWGSVPKSGPQWVPGYVPQSGSGRSAKWGLEYNTA